MLRGLWPIRLSGVVVLALAMLAGMPALAAVAQKADVRVLIDISGSMRQNDPQNLRRPALRMLSGLLQPGTRAGVWTFARWVNNLVPVAEVDAAWRARTQSLSEQISSPGQFTNIEEVLDRASRDWRGQPTTHARHLLLLTDGMVDVSKDPRDNEQSRARILDSLLPRLKAAGVRVHTIALSERADHGLMQRLAGETGGWYQQVIQADDLQRVFLRMFETVGQPDSLPLDDNRFVVDDSVSEATILVFTRPEAEPVVLRAPSGEDFTDSDLPAGIVWFRDQGYQLITIADPLKGEWRLQADVDPDNRVMIVTDLKLQTSEVPSHIAVGEQAHIEAFLTNRGELVDRPAFLRLLDLYASTATGQGEAEHALNDAGEAGDEQAADGRYTLRYSETQARDVVELLIAVDSPTFMREKRLHLAVHEPIEARVVAGAEGPVLTVSLQAAVIRPGAQVSAWQEDARGQRLALAVVAAPDGRWTTALVDPAAPVYAKVVGTTAFGNRIERIVGPLMPPGVLAPAAPAPTESEPVAPAPEQPVAPEPQWAGTSATADSHAAAEDWSLPVMVFGGLNLLLLIGGGAWFWLHRRAGGGNELDLDLLIIDQVAVPAADGSAADGEAA